MNSFERNQLTAIPYGETLRGVLEQNPQVLGSTFGLDHQQNFIVYPNNQTPYVLINAGVVVSPITIGIVWNEIKMMQDKTYIPQVSENIWNSLNVIVPLKVHTQVVEHQEEIAFDLTPEKKMELIKKIVAFGVLKDGWDGYSARKIDDIIIKRAVDIFNKIFCFLYSQDIYVKDVFPYPLANGGVRIDIDAKELEIEIEIDNDPKNGMTYLVEWLGKNRFKRFQEGTVKSLYDLLAYLNPTK